MQSKVLFSILATLLLLSATRAQASVLINEIAWMGTVNGSADEWIELVNTGSANVDLSGWSVRAQDGSPLIVLSGNILGNGFYLIERTDDATVPDVSADLVTPFGNGLSNSGETLQLFDASDVLIDSVVGGEGWSAIGGDSVTKATAQRTPAGWVTSVGTPKASNESLGGEVLGASTPSSATLTAPGSNSATVGTSRSVPGLYPRTNIVVDAGSDRRGFVGFPVLFSGSSTGLYNEMIERATYRWNFGDGTTADTRMTEHVYAISGEYVVTLEVFWSSYHERDRLTATIVKPDVSILRVTEGATGYVELQNGLAREIDISGWSIRSIAPGPMFVFPDNSIILGGKSFLLPNVVTGFSGASTLSLHFPNGAIADEWPRVMRDGGVTKVGGQVAGAKTVRTAASLATSLSATKSAAGGDAPSASTVVNRDAATSSLASVVLWEPPTSVVGGGSSLFSLLAENMSLLFALCATSLVLFAAVTIYRSRDHDTLVEEEYAIIEDIIEGKEAAN